MVKPLSVIGILREIPPDSTPNEAVMAVWEAQGIYFDPVQKDAIRNAVNAHTISATLNRIKQTVKPKKKS